MHVFRSKKATSRVLYGPKKAENELSGIYKTSTAQQFGVGEIDYAAKAAEFAEWTPVDLEIESDPSTFVVNWEGYDGLFLGATVSEAGSAFREIAPSRNSPITYSTIRRGSQPPCPTTHLFLFRRS